MIAGSYWAGPSFCAEMEIGLSEAEKEAIFHGNLTRLTGLAVKG